MNSEQLTIYKVSYFNLYRDVETPNLGVCEWTMNNGMAQIPNPYKGDSFPPEVDTAI